jgi:hypothetical protein
VRKSWIWDSKLNKLVPKEDYQRPERLAPYVQPDITPYVPVGGPEAKRFIDDPKSARLIEGRKQHREYLKRNGFIEVGNEKSAFTKYGGKTAENHARLRPRSPEVLEWMKRSNRD